jgi:putative transposase
MTEYRRTWHPGATWFFTVNLAERRGNRLLVDRIDVLRIAFRNVRTRHPFHIEAIVILPDHLHCVWTLGLGDMDFSTRWSLIKGYFSRTIEKGERISQSRAKRVNGVYGSAVSGNISSAIKLTSTVTWITSIGTRKDMDG